MADEIVINMNNEAATLPEVDSSDNGKVLAVVDGEWDKSGNYPQKDGIIANAEQLKSNIFELDKVPYNFRTAGGTIDIGDRMTDKIVGGTVVWNQLVELDVSKMGTSDNGTPTCNSANHTITNTATTNTKIYAAVRVRPDNTFIGGHIYLAAFKCIEKSENVKRWTVKIAGVAPSSYQSDMEVGKTYFNLVSYPVDWSTTTHQFNISSGDNSVLLTTSDYGTCEIMILDITQLFGSTAIGNYIYSLEQATAGAGVKVLTDLFPKLNGGYYAYNGGELISVNTSSHNTIGFNQWDEEYTLTGIVATTGAIGTWTNRITSKNFIPALPSTSYYFKSSSVSATSFYIHCYAEDKAWLGVATTTNGYGYVERSGGFETLPNTAYIKFAAANDSYGTTYKNDICINLHWDGERDGEYEAYVKNEYPLDSDLELRGVPKLDANNSLYYDGDEYTDDGTVKRRYGVVDLGTLNYWSAPSESNAVSNTGLESEIKFPSTNAIVADIICNKYINVCRNDIFTADKLICVNYGGTIIVVDSALAGKTAAEVKTALTGVYVIYKLAAPTTEEADPFTNPQIVDDFGTEEYVDTREVAIPVGHETKYMPNLRAKLEMAPDSPNNGDGDYIVRQTSGLNEYVKIAIPTKKIYQHIVSIMLGTTLNAKVSIINNSADAITSANDLLTAIGEHSYPATGQVMDNTQGLTLIGLVINIANSGGLVATWGAFDGTIGSPISISSATVTDSVIELQ